MMTMDLWVSKYLGVGIDYDGTYGVQCVDLVKHFVYNVLGVEPQSIGNAIEYYNKRKTSNYLLSNFNWISNTSTFVPKKGDICVFTSKSGHGHVSIATGEGTTSYFYSYDQNYPSGKHEPMTLIKHNYSSFLGVLRPKNQSNIVTSAPNICYGNYTLNKVRAVYKGYGAKSGKKLVSDLTDSGKKCATSSNSNDYAYLKKGSKITVLQTKLISSGNLWARIPSGYICIWECKGNKLFVD